MDNSPLNKKVLDNSARALAAVLVAASIFLSNACTGNLSASRGTKKIFTNGDTQETPSDPGLENLEHLVREIGIDPDDHPIKILTAGPREELIEKLAILGAKRANDKFITLNIAYLLCLINHEYIKNRLIIVNELQESEPKFQESAMAMAENLIKRGDTDLLSDVFDISERTDGAVSEEISAIYFEAAANQGEAFLMNLTKANSGAKSDVLNRLANDSSEEEKMAIRNTMKTLLSNANVAQVAREILSTINAKRGNRR